MDRQLLPMVAVGRVGGGRREDKEDSVLRSQHRWPPRPRPDAVSVMPLPMPLAKSLNLPELMENRSDAPKDLKGLGSACSWPWS